MKKAIVLLLVFGAGVGVAVLATSGRRETYIPTAPMGAQERAIRDSFQRAKAQRDAEEAAFRGAVRAAAYDRAINH